MGMMRRRKVLPEAAMKKRGFDESARG